MNKPSTTTAVVKTIKKTGVLRTIAHYALFEAPCNAVSELLRMILADTAKLFRTL
jgi:hypothetical protein